MNIEKILVPLDGSVLAEKILHHLSELIRSVRPKLLLLRAVDFPVGWGDKSPALEEAQEYVSTVEARLRAEGLDADSMVWPGPAAEAILKIAAQERASMIAMSSHGRSGISRWVYGSVAEKVLRASPIPVLVAHVFRRPPRGFGRILVPLDGSERSMAIVPWVLELRKALDSQITLLHVFEKMKRPDELGPPDLPLQAAVERFRAAGARVATDFRSGDPAEETLKACEEGLHDLVAVASHGRTGLARWVFGSVAEKILQGAAVPLFVVKSIAEVSSSEAPARSGTHGTLLA